MAESQRRSPVQELLCPQQEDPPKLPSDVAVLRGLYVKADLVIGELRLGFADAARKAAWVNDRSAGWQQRPSPELKPTTWGADILTHVEDMLQFLPLNDLALIRRLTNAEGQDLRDEILSAFIGFRTRIAARLESLARSDEPIAPTECAGDPEPSRAVKLSELHDDAMMNHVDLARRLSLKPESLRKRLDRWRSKNGNGWQEAMNPPPKAPKYAYQVGAVRSVLAKAIADESSG